MGVEPYLVASSVEAILAQRLVRVLCPKCKTPETSDRIPAIRKQGNIAEDVTIYQANGCEACRQTGYHGRQAIFEMMDMTKEVRQMALNHCSSGELRDQARKDGMTMLSEDGWRLVGRGITTPNEIMRVTKDEQASVGKV